MEQQPLAKGRSLMKKEDSAISATKQGILGKPIGSCMEKDQIGKRRKPAERTQGKQALTETQGSIEPSMCSKEQLEHLYKLMNFPVL